MYFALNNPLFVMIPFWLASYLLTIWLISCLFPAMPVTNTKTRFNNKANQWLNVRQNRQPTFQYRRWREYLVLIMTTILLQWVVLPVAASGGEESIQSAATFSNEMIIGVSLTAAMVVGTGWHMIKSRWIESAIAGLVVMTSLLHLMIGVDALLILASGVGYLTIFSALYLLPVPMLKELRAPLYWFLTVYTMLMVFSFFASHPWGMKDGSLEWLRLLSNITQVILLVLLIVNWRQQK